MGSELLLENFSYTKKITKVQGFMQLHKRNCVWLKQNMSQLVLLMNRTMVKYVGLFLEISYLGSWADTQQSETH